MRQGVFALPSVIDTKKLICFGNESFCKVFKQKFINRHSKTRDIGKIINEIFKFTLYNETISHALFYFNVEIKRQTYGISTVVHSI